MFGDLAIVAVTFAAGWFARAKFGTFAEMKAWVLTHTKKFTS